MEVEVLKVEDPSCFWIAIKECVPGVVSESVYENLHAEMKQFYDSSKKADDLKQEEIEKGQVYVVFSEELKCWCRALVQSIWRQVDGYQLGCFLVDYAKYCSLPSKNVRVLAGAFAKIPYRAKKCRLHCTKPLTLYIDYCKDTAKIGPAKRWDTAAIHHFRKLLEEATEAKATIQAVEDEVLDVSLFVTVRDEKICVNDDLVAKYFAHYKEAEGPSGSSSDDSDKEVSLSAECVPVEFVGPTFLARPKLPFGGEMSPHPGPGLAGCNSAPEKTSQRSHTVLNDNTVPVVSMVPGLPSKEDKAVQTERLLKFLSSNSCQTHTVEGDQQSFQNVEKEKNFVFLSKKIEPSSVLETAPLFDGLKKELAWNKFSGPTFTESYCWPPVAWGCDVVAISHQGNDPLLYIPPVLTLLQLESVYQALPSMSGPLALILCPGWKKAHLAYDLLRTYRKGCRRLRLTLVILGLSKEANSQVEIGGLVQVVETPANNEENKVTIKYIDEGRTSQVNNDQLLHLPAKFQSLPPQAVEIVVCGVKPIDNEVEWNPEVTKHINHKIKGKLHHAKVVHTLGKTVWVDPMAGVSRLPSIKTWINEYNIRSKILSMGLGTDNPEHVGEIQKLCRHIPVLEHAERLESTNGDTAGPETSSPQDAWIQENC
ncbi:putative ATP-dependent RNA helicase TDRD12 [Hirundo rustica]|uniref:putative ATP-dependent RNA helicase TDRD12 n=1 Tax=Hirundo rustica TaxID=43150 RepID=UPI001A93CD26|nr:putative ATP-dependent RNA helicase TDRD12 [Hirundo rustica]